MDDQVYQNAVETSNYQLTRCLDFALGSTERNICKIKFN